jgi:hypothetical protein
MSNLWLGAVMNLFAAIARFLGPGVASQAIRMEIYRLGSRHHGDALEGARLELEAAGLERGRERLLRAVVHHLS